MYRDEDPLLVVAGEGNYLIDIEGRRYLDGVASLWCNSLGHRRPEIDQAVHDQLGRIAHATLLGNATVPAIRLAHRLVEVTPEGLTRVFFSDNGSTAVEVALKIALQYWQQADGGRQARRTRFLGLGEAYHGDTVGSVAMGGIELFHRKFAPLLFDTVRSPSPYCYRCPLDKEPETCEIACATELERLVGEHGDELAAVVIEPGFLGAGGIITYPPDFLRRAREVTTQVGALLIFDEVAVGMGRSGFLLAMGSTILPYVVAEDSYNSLVRPPKQHVASLAAIHRSAFVPILFADPGKQPLVLTEAYRALAKDKVRPDLPKAVFFRPMSNPAHPLQKNQVAGYDYVVLFAQDPGTVPVPPFLNEIETGTMFVLYRVNMSE